VLPALIRNLVMEERKARLAALAAKAGRTKPIETEDPGSNDTSVPERGVKFRNYTPIHSSLTSDRGGGNESGDVDNNSSVGLRGVQPASKRLRPNEVLGSTAQPSVLEAALAKARSEIQSNESSLPVHNGALSTPAHVMTPKKINADLKRKIQPQLDKLLHRTQKAIVALLKERLEKEAAAEAALDNANDLD
jgi:cwf18 pre-mRNA splicing factor